MVSVLLHVAVGAGLAVIAAALITTVVAWLCREPAYRGARRCDRAGRPATYQPRRRASTGYDRRPAGAHRPQFALI